MNHFSRRALFVGVTIAALVLGYVVRDQREGGSSVVAVASSPKGTASGTKTIIDLNGAQFVRWAAPREMPHLAFSDEKGNAVSLRNFRGRVVLLNLWATWCPPCREEMPSLDRLNAARRSPRFEVVALALDSPHKTLAFLRSLGTRTLHGYTDDNGTALRTLDIVSVPTTLLIDAKGREVGRTTGPAAWDSPAALKLIDDILKEQI